MRLSNSYTVVRVAVQHTEAVSPAHGMTYGSIRRFASADDLDYYEIREDAQELAASRGYEGDVFYREKDEDLGEIKYVKINLSEENLGIWLAEVSDVNGCESFGKWDEQSQEFYNEYKKSKKSKNKNKNRFANAGDSDDCGHDLQTGKFGFKNTCAEGSGQGQEESAGTTTSGPDPVEVEKNLSSLYKKAPHVKDEIDSLAEHIATEEDRGSYVIKAPVKSMKRSIEKCINDYGGDVSRMKDIARNTIAAPDEIHENVIASLKRMGASVKVIDCEDDPMGYSGVNSSLKTEYGMYGEIQVNSSEMIFAKEPPNIAKAILGEEKWEEIANRTGAEGGLGHHYYEEYRSLPLGDPCRDHIEKKSRDYYDSIRGGC